LSAGLGYATQSAKGGGATSYFPVSAITDRLSARNQLDDKQGCSLIYQQSSTVTGQWSEPYTLARRWAERRCGTKAPEIRM
jgi:hypothetical protein